MGFDDIESSAAFVWGSIEFWPLVTALVATFAGVFLALLLSSAQERRRQRVASQHRFAGACKEIIGFISDLHVLRNGIETGSLPRALSMKPARALTFNLPVEPVMAPDAISERQASGEAGMASAMNAYRSLSNSRRLYQALSTVASNDTPAILDLIDATVEGYADLAWSLRNLHLGTTAEFDADEWTRLLRRVKETDSVTPFLTT